MISEIQILQNVFFLQTVPLDGQTYKLSFRWVPKRESSDLVDGSWYMDIGDDVVGIKVVNGINLLAPYQYMESIPQGTLTATRNFGRSSKPSFLNFGIGKEVSLLYDDLK